jgi:hypothetical protein
MFDLVANDNREDIHDDLANDEKCCSEKNISQRPSIIQSVNNQNDLKNDIDNESDAVDDEIKDPQHRRAGVAEGTVFIKGGDGDSADEDEDDKGTDTDGLDGRGR